MSGEWAETWSRGQCEQLDGLGIRCAWREGHDGPHSFEPPRPVVDSEEQG